MPAQTKGEELSHCDRTRHTANGFQWTLVCFLKIQLRHSKHNPFIVKNLVRVTRGQLGNSELSTNLRCMSRCQPLPRCGSNSTLSYLATSCGSGLHGVEIPTIGCRLVEAPMACSIPASCVESTSTLENQLLLLIPALTHSL